MKCAKCGYEKNDEGTRMCNLCGEVLPRPSVPAPPGETVVSDAPVAVPPPPAVAVKITKVEEPKPGTDSGVFAAEGGFCHLKCSLLDRPLRLNPDKPASIGRSPDNDITIPSQMVSRKHGTVAYENQLWIYTDLNSSNGSRVNGERVTRAALQSGDVIDLGGFLITYREIHDLADIAEGSASGGMDEGKTMAIDANMLKKMRTGGMGAMGGGPMMGGLGGSLADIAIPDILQLLEMQRKSGTLSLDFDGAVGKIHLRDGRMVHAEYGKITGEKAVHKVLARNTGSFHFDPTPPECETTIDRDTTSVLLDASRAMDEAG